MIRRLLHHLVARPGVYNLVQFAAGGPVVHRHLAEQVTRTDCNGLVLDLGGGTGVVRPLCDASSRYICLDLDPIKLESFHRRYPGDPVLLSDACQVPLKSRTVDCVLCVFLTHHVSDESLAMLISETRRVLRKGGELVLAEALWNPARVVSKLLWRYDRGSFPRTRDHLWSALSKCYDHIAEDQFAVHHEYVIFRAERALRKCSGTADLVEHYLE